MAESARLLNGYTPKGYRGFESHPLRHFHSNPTQKPRTTRFFCQAFMQIRSYLVQWLSNETHALFRKSQGVRRLTQPPVNFIIPRSLKLNLA